MCVTNPLNYIVLLAFLCIVGDAIRRIRENGFRDNTFYYHLGDGSHAYHYNVDTQSSIYFKCVMYHQLRCFGRAILKHQGRGRGFRHSNDHNHPPDPDFVGERHFRENVLQQCADARFVNFKDILDEARQNRKYSRRVRSKMTMRRLGTSMYKARMRSYPAIPHSLRELTQLLLNRQWRHISRTVDGDDNLYAGSTTARDGSHHVVFMSRRIREFVGHHEINLIQSDGTFRARPNVPPSSQCFVLVTTWRNTVVPLGWILMEARTLLAYRAVFNLLKQLCPDLNPHTIVTDWEYPQQKAWQEAFPHADIQGCLWHLCRAFVKKARKLGLLRFRNALPDLMGYIRKACAVALLPVRYFRIGLGLLKREARETDILIAYLLREFFQYVEKQWVGNRVRRKWMCLFNSIHRTNNSCESLNKMLRKKVGAYRPNVYAFIDACAALEHNAYLDIELLRRGGNPSRSRRWQSVFADQQLQALSRDLEMDIFGNRNAAVLAFLGRASQLFRNAYDQHVEREAGR